MARRERIATLLGAALVVTYSAAAAAQPRTRSEVAQSREQFRVGVDAARQERWAEARRAFERAYELVQDPVTLLNLAGAQERSGSVLLATESYRRFLREATTEPAVRYRDVARQTLEELERRTPHLLLQIHGLRAGDAVVLDGTAISPATLGAALPVDPGSHTVEVQRAGRVLARTAVDASPDRTRRVELLLPPEAGPEPPTRPAVAPQAVAVREPARPLTSPDAATTARVFAPRGAQRQSRLRVHAAAPSPWIWVAVSAGVLALAGTAVGVTAFALATSDERFRGNIPPESAAIR